MSVCCVCRCVQDNVGCECVLLFNKKYYKITNSYMVSIKYYILNSDSVENCLRLVRNPEIIFQGSCLWLMLG